MLIKGDYRILSPPVQVWKGLHDPDLLKQSLPGCREMVRESDTRFRAKVGIKVGPLSASFSGHAEISDSDPPHSCRITGEGSGGAAGFANASAVVNLTPAEGGTMLRYEGTVTVGGKLAQIGSRLVEATARKLADEFFARFANRVGGTETAAAPPDSELGRPTSRAGGLDTWIWLLGVVVLAALLLIIFAR